MDDNTSGKHQTIEHGGPLSKTKTEKSSVNYSTGLTIRRFTCPPVASEIINWPEIREFISAFEKVDANDCNVSQRHVYRNKIIEMFSLGIEKLSCETLQDVHESIIEKLCQKNGAQIRKQE